MEPREQPQLRRIGRREIKSEELRGEELYSNAADPAGGRKTGQKYLSAFSQMMEWMISFMTFSCCLNLNVEINKHI